MRTQSQRKVDEAIDRVKDYLHRYPEEGNLIPIATILRYAVHKRRIEDNEDEFKKLPKKEKLSIMLEQIELISIKLKELL